MELSNFYSDYAFNPEDFELVEGMYRKVVQAVADYLFPLQDNRIVRYIEDYRIVPVQYLDISGASYSPQTLLTSEQLKAWPSMEIEEKVQILKENGRYIQLVADRQLSRITPINNVIEESIDESHNKIIDFTLWDPDEDGYKLVYGIDYYYADNQIFFFGEYAAPLRNRVILKMTNVAIDFNTVNDIIGKNLELTFAPDKIPKIEFNDFVRTLTLAAAKGFVLKDLESGINELYAIKDYVEIFDKNVADPEKAAMWKDGTLDLGPFDFAVYFPADLDYYRISLICEFLDKVRYSSSHYQAISYDEQIEEYNRNVTGDELWDEISYDQDTVDTYGVLEFEDINFYLNDEDKKTNRANALLGYVDSSKYNIPSDEDGFDDIEEETIDVASLKYDDSESGDTESYRPSDKQLFLGKRVMQNLETEDNNDFIEINPSLLNDANSRLAYASDEDKSTSE